MRVFVFVNRVQEIGFRQTTALLITALYNQGHPVHLASVDGLSLLASRQATHVVANAVPLKLDSRAGSIDSRVTANFAQSIDESMFETSPIQTDDVILIRTNPGRDAARWAVHQSFLELGQVARSHGIRVINDPTHLLFYASKASVAVLEPRFRPQMIVSQDLRSILDFIRQADGDCVAKPLVGSRGNDVVRVSALTENLEEDLARLFANRSVVVQHFVPSAEPGDKRVVVLEGNLIEFDGHLAGIHRVPTAGEFRANLHAGGNAHPLQLSSQQREAVEHAAAILYADGIRLAGIDLIGTKVIEFNVFSTGGLYDASQFAGQDFAERIIDRLVIAGGSRNRRR